MCASPQVLFANKQVNGVSTRITDEEFENWPTYSASSIVTPLISGLHNPEAIQAIFDAGHKTVVGDNSRMDLQPVNVHHAFASINGVHGGM